MKTYLTSINLSIISLGVAVFYYLLMNFTPVVFHIPVESYVYISKIFALMESIIAVFALIMGIKEKNKAHVILAILLLIMFLKPFLFDIVDFIYNLH